SRRAVERARLGQGPTFLEFRTYRWRGHVGASWDEDVGVQRKNELSEWLPKDPLLRLKNLLLEKGVSLSEINGMDRDAVQEADAALLFAKSSPLPLPGTLLKHVFAPPRGANA